MAEYYHCFACKTAIQLFTTAVKCPRCGGTSGEMLSQERFAEKLKAGIFAAGFKKERGKKPADAS